MNLIERKQYTNTLFSLKEKDLIKVVTGIRRSGKSTIYQLYISQLLKQGVPKSSIFQYNFEDIENEKYLHNYNLLYSEICKVATSNKNIYVFLDEIQKVDNFEALVNSLHLKPNIDVYITGSNAYLLSSEFATYLTGRTFEINVLPFSFKEYTLCNELEISDQQLFNQYMRNGGMPGIFQLDNSLQLNYITNVVSDILTKDILIRNKLRKSVYFDNILKFMCSSIGSDLSANNISNVLKSEGFEMSPATIESYLKNITDSYLFYKAPKYDIKGKMLLKTREKYYAVDLGLRTALLGDNATDDIGHKLENVVYLELLRKGYSVKIGKIDRNEVDFVCQKNEETLYVQVSQTILDETTKEREFLPFKKIRDNFPKMILTLDSFNFSQYGIIHKNIIDWLLEGEV